MPSLQTATLPPGYLRRHLQTPTPSLKTLRHPCLGPHTPVRLQDRHASVTPGQPMAMNPPSPGRQTDPASAHASCLVRDPVVSGTPDSSTPVSPSTSQPARPTRQLVTSRIWFSCAAGPNPHVAPQKSSSQSNPVPLRQTAGSDHGTSSNVRNLTHSAPPAARQSSPRTRAHSASLCPLDRLLVRLVFLVQLEPRPQPFQHRLRGA